MAAIEQKCAFNLQILPIFNPKSKKMRIFASVIVCHDDEMTLGSGSFSGISQQLLKRW